MAIDGKWLLRSARSFQARRDILVALSVKLVLLTCLYLLFFGPAHRPPSDASATAGALMGADFAKDSR